MDLILRANNEEIRQALKAAGIEVCVCASFVDAVWLHYLPETNSVHGVGYYGEENETRSVAEEIGSFILDCKEPYLCRDVEEFIDKICSLRKA